MKWVNLTRHHINVVRANGSLDSFPPCGTVVRVESWQTDVDKIDGINLVETEFGTVIGMPPPEEDTMYITSSLVARALSDRRDIVAPNTHPEAAVVDAQRRKIAVKGFQVFWDEDGSPLDTGRPIET